MALQDKMLKSFAYNAASDSFGEDALCGFNELGCFCSGASFSAAFTIGK
jgi:hypothetical protein